MRHPGKSWLPPSIAQRSRLGLHIGQSSLAFVELENNAYNKVCLLACHQIPLGSPAPAATELSQQIRLAWHALQTDSTQVHLSLPPEQACCRLVNLPASGRRSQQDALRAEAAALCQLPVAEVTFDYQHLPSTEAKKSSVHQAFLLCAAPRELVSEQLCIIRNAGLDPQSVQLMFFALQTVCDNNPDWLARKAMPRGILHADQTLHLFSLAAGHRLPVLTSSSAQHDNAGPSLLPLALQEALLAPPHDTLFVCGPGAAALRRSLAGLLPNSTILLDPFEHFAMARHLDHQQLADHASRYTLALGLALNATRAKPA